MNQRMRVLIAYDGSWSADAAIEDLRWAGLPARGDALVLSVADTCAPPSAASARPITVGAVATVARPSLAPVTQAIERAQELAEQARHRFQTLFPAWQVTALADVMAPAWIVIIKAEAWRADLVVLGATGHSSLWRAGLGRVAQKVANEAHGSVRVARGRLRPIQESPRLLLGLDGSAPAELAARAVAARAWPKRSEARVLTVLDPARLSPALTREEHAWADQLSDQTAEQLRAAGLRVTSQVKTGTPQRVLLDEAERWGADSVVLGARGLNGPGRWLLGSVASTVAMGAPCSVEVVRGHLASDR